MGAAVLFLGLSSEVPDVGDIEAYFAGDIGPRYRPTVLLDRTGTIVVAELTHPLASDQRWLDWGQTQSGTAPSRFVEATLAAQDPEFWSHNGYRWEQLLAALTARVFGGRQGGATITEQLVQQTLLFTGSAPDARLILQRAHLAAQLTRRYSRGELLTWYLNSAHYGNLAFGADAAALVYFGKHANELNLAESALLAGLPSDPRANPIDDPAAARRLQRTVLESMLAAGYITETEAERAREQPLNVQAASVRAGLARSDFLQYALGQLNAILGEGADSRGGLRVVTSIDPDLQLQVECTTETHVQRLLGGDPGAIVAAADGSACVAATLLPPMRPGDAGVDHNLSGAAVVILDPTNGEILALADVESQGPDTLSAELPRPAGSMFDPFIYLTAFAGGFTPGTMVLDVPVDELSSDASSAEASSTAAEYQGPVRMRIAFVNGYRAAAIRTLELIGLENVLRTSQRMGVRPAESQFMQQDQPLQDPAVASLNDLAFSFAVMANGGRMVGWEGAPPEQEAPPRELEPTAVLQVEDASGRVLFSYEPSARVVLSPQLAFLMNDILSDEPARWSTFGQANPLEVGRPAAALAGLTEPPTDSWTVGYTPSRLVAIWLGNRDDEPMRLIGRQNGAAPIWHALLRYATRERPAEAWTMPPGVGTLDVCDPSGLLPTAYCPQVVQELFIQGTEPTTFDDLYQPFRINRETGKLATLFTPIDLVEERVYLIPPAEAAGWAQAAGIEHPPVEYDLLYPDRDVHPEVQLLTPEPFDLLRGDVLVRGTASEPQMDYYRLQYGQGLNPSRWVQIGSDSERPVRSGTLGRWDTSGLNGLYILQLLVVLSDGRIETSAVPVTVDNEAPEAEIISPLDGDRLSLEASGELLLEALARDIFGVARVEFYVDGRRVAVADQFPYVAAWRPSRPGSYQLEARVFDTAGNLTISDVVEVVVVP